MKRGIWIVLMISLVACGDNVVGTEDSLIGSWRANQGTETVTWTFQNWGTLRIVKDSETDEVSFFSTRFTVDGDNVTIQAYPRPDNQGDPVSFPATSCTADVNDRSLRLQCDTGVATFTRVGPSSEANAA